MTDAELLASCHTVFPGHRARTPAQMFAAMAAWCEQNNVAHDVYGNGALIEAFGRRRPPGLVERSLIRPATGFRMTSQALGRKTTRPATARLERWKTAMK